MPIRARSNFPPRSTAVTVPSSSAPAGIAVRPSTVTSRETRAVIRSSTLAVSEETAFSKRMPITASSLTVISSKRGFGGAGGGASTTGGGAISGVTGAGGADGRGCCADRCRRRPPGAARSGAAGRRRSATGAERRRPVLIGLSSSEARSAGARSIGSSTRGAGGSTATDVPMTAGGWE